MATTVVLNGVSYSIPAIADQNWSGSGGVDGYLIALATGVLTKAGGAFSLTNELDLGPSYGLKSLYLKSRATNPSSTGQVRLGNTEAVSWRNAANGADLALAVAATNKLQYNSIDLADISTAQTLTNKTIDSASNTISNIVDANVSASAAIAYSKLALTGSIVNADINSSAAIAYSKLNLATSVVNADISASAAIAYSKLNLGTSILNADISASAAIAFSKLATLSSGNILVGNVSNVAASVAVTGDVTISNAGVTAIGANKVANSQLAQIATARFKGRTTASTGDVEDLTATQATALLNAVVGDSGSGGTKGLAPAPGSGDAAANKFLKADGTWATTGALSNPMTTGGDIIYGGASGVVTRLANGSAGQVLTSSGTTVAPTWASAPNPLLSIATKTTTYGAATSDDLILCSTSAFTVTLYAASGNTGKVIRIKKTDSSLTNIITIDGNASETIDGALTTTLNTQYEEVTLVCDGSNWHVISRVVPSQWVAWTPTFTGMGTVSGVSFYSRRRGPDLHVRGRVTTGTVSGSTAAISLGFNGTDGGLTIGSSSLISSSIVIVGTGAVNRNSGVPYTVLAVAGGTTVNLSFSAAATGGTLTAQTGSNALNNTTDFAFEFTVPISGWNG